MRNKIPFFFLCLFATLFHHEAAAQVDSLSPLEVVEHYISPKGFPRKARYFCCELAGESRADSTLGQLLPAKVERTATLIFQDSTRAMVAIWLRDSTTTRDFYIYLSFNKRNWVMTSIRSLVLRDAAAAELHRLDSVPVNERGKAYTRKTGHNWAFERNNIKLWMASDDALIKHFQLHQQQLESIRKQLVAQHYILPGDTVCKNVMDNKKMVRKLDQLLVREVTMDRGYPNTLMFVIGGIDDNTVGYLYQPDPTKLPPCNARYYILLRPLGNGWYLYKTT